MTFVQGQNSFLGWRKISANEQHLVIGKRIGEKAPENYHRGRSFQISGGTSATGFERIEVPRQRVGQTLKK